MGVETVRLSVRVSLSLRREIDAARERSGRTLTDEVEAQLRLALAHVEGGRYAGRIRIEVVPDRTAKSLTSFVQSAVLPGTMVVSDAAPSYARLEKLGYEHLPVVEAGDPAVAEEYLPIVHLIFSNLKSWLRGCHHGVSPQHLQAYLNEFAFRFNRRFYPFNAFRSLLGIGGDTAAPTYASLYSGEWKHATVSGHD